MVVLLECTLIFTFMCLQLASDFEKSIPCEESHLLPVLRQLLVERFGATPKNA